MSLDEAQALAEQLLALDDSILATIIVDDKGKGLAYINRQNPEAEAALGEEEIGRIGLVEFLGAGMAPRPGQQTGNFEYVAYVYERFKIMIVESYESKWVIGLRLARSSNMEYVFRLLQKCLRHPPPKSRRPLQDGPRSAGGVGAQRMRRPSVIAVPARRGKPVSDTDAVVDRLPISERQLALPRFLLAHGLVGTWVAY
jgi:hypothetical protein